MKKTLLAVFAAMLVLGTNSAAWANGPYTSTLPTTAGIPTPFETYTPVNNAPDVFMAVNLLLGSSYASNAAIAPLEVTGNTKDWQYVGDALHGGAALIGLSAGNANSLKVYDTATPGTKLDVFGTPFSGFGFTGDGTIADPYPYQAIPLAYGTKFGWALSSYKASTGSTTVWDSDYTKNSDKFDHMIVYHLPALAGKTIYVQDTKTLAIKSYTYTNPYLLAWEDLSLRSNGAFSDQDYNDMMYVVDSVLPVPEPSTVALFAFGLVGLGVFTLRRKLMMA